MVRLKQLPASPINSLSVIQPANSYNTEAPDKIPYAITADKIESIASHYYTKLTIIY